MLSRKIGIDLGTSRVRIFVKGEGVVLNEPALTTGDRDSTQVLHRLIGKAKGRPRLFKPEVVVSVPSNVTATERRAVTEAAMAAGARQVWLIDEPLAAAMGAGLPIGELRASAVGGRSLDKAIAEALGIAEREAEEVKIAVGSAVVMEEPLVTSVGDREVSSNDIAKAVEGPLRAITAAIRKVLAETPREHIQALAQRGIVLSGGAAQLRGLAEFVAAGAGVPAVVADDPQTSVVRGTGLALDHFEVMRRNQSYLR